MAETALTWAVLAPFSHAELRQRADRVWQQRLGPGLEDVYRPWDVIAGSGAYSAVLDRNPGSEYTHEIPLARALSKATDHPVYVLYLDEDFAGASVVDRYQAGAKKGSLPDSPYGLAERLGCPLRAAAPAAPPVRGVVVVEGAPKAQVARVLELAPGAALRIDDSPTGTLVRAEPVGQPPLVARDLSRAFPDRDVYTVSTGPTPGRFVCQVVRQGGLVGSYSVPAALKAGWLGGPTLSSIKGETDPRAIADKLGIPRQLLGLE